MEANKGEKSGEKIAKDAKAESDAPKKDPTKLHEQPDLKTFKDGQEYITNMPLERRKEVGAKGGKAGSVGKGKAYSLCHVCDMRFVCQRAYEESSSKKGEGDRTDLTARCVYEMENRHKSKEKLNAEMQAFAGVDPADHLMKIQRIYNQLEKIVEDDPSYTKVANLFYMMTNLYKLKFGDKGMSINIANIQSGGGSEQTSLDVKDIMKTIREMNKDKDDQIIDVDVVDDDNEGEVP